MTGFDHARPLWEMVVLEGLEDGRAALVQKIHHSLSDGVGMMKLSMAFLDIEPEPATDLGPMPEVPSGEHPSLIDQFRSGIAYQARRQAATLATVSSTHWSSGPEPSGSLLRSGSLRGLRRPHAASRCPSR